MAYFCALTANVASHMLQTTSNTFFILKCFK
jgi:hypothetical protein